MSPQQKEMLEFLTPLCDNPEVLKEMPLEVLYELYLEAYRLIHPLTFSEALTVQ